MRHMIRVGWNESYPSLIQIFEDPAHVVLSAVREARGEYRLDVREPVEQRSGVNVTTDGGYLAVVGYYGPKSMRVHVHNPRGGSVDDGFHISWLDALNLNEMYGKTWDPVTQTVVRSAERDRKLGEILELKNKLIGEVQVENLTKESRVFRASLTGVWGMTGTPMEKVEGAVAAARGDAHWLTLHGEDAHSLRALVEAVDAAAEGISSAVARGALDSRAKFVNSLAAEASYRDCTCEVCGSSESSTRIVCVDCYGDEDPSDETVEDVPLGGLSHEDAHFLISGVKTAIDMLDKARAWPDDARRVMRFLGELLK